MLNGEGKEYWQILYAKWLGATGVSTRTLVILSFNCALETCVPFSSNGDDRY